VDGGHADAGVADVAAQHADRPVADVRGAEHGERDAKAKASFEHADPSRCEM
jgi:hypothetical protein